MRSRDRDALYMNVKMYELLDAYQVIIKVGQFTDEIFVEVAFSPDKNQSKLETSAPRKTIDRLCCARTHTKNRFNFFNRFNRPDEKTGWV